MTGASSSTLKTALVSMDGRIEPQRGRLTGQPHRLSATGAADRGDGGISLQSRSCDPKLALVNYIPVGGLVQVENRPGWRKARR